MKVKSLILVETSISHNSEALIYKHCITNELSFWQDVFSIDKNWKAFHLVEISNENLKEKDWCYTGKHVDIFRYNMRAS